jgi:hypothetical protein
MLHRTYEGKYIMDVKQAVVLSKEHIIHLFGEEKLTNLGLEEVEYDENAQEWIVTIGFSRPWDEPRNTLMALTQTVLPNRAYKIVRISDRSSQVLSVKNREKPS